MLSIDLGMHGCNFVAYYICTALGIIAIIQYSAGNDVDVTLEVVKVMSG